MADAGGIDVGRLVACAITGEGDEALAQLRELDLEQVSELARRGGLKSDPKDLLELVRGSETPGDLVQGIQELEGVSLSELAGILSKALGF